MTMQDFVKIEIHSPSGIEKAKAIGRLEFNQKRYLSPKFGILSFKMSKIISTITKSTENTIFFDEPNKNLNVLDLETSKQQRDGI